MKGENVIRIEYFYLLGSKNKNQFNEIDAKVGNRIMLFIYTHFVDRPTKANKKFWEKKKTHKKNQRINEKDAKRK